MQKEPCPLTGGFAEALALPVHKYVDPISRTQGQCMNAPSEIETVRVQEAGCGRYYRWQQPIGKL